MSELDARVLGLQTFKQPTVVVGANRAYMLTCVFKNQFVFVAGTEGCGKSAFLVAWSRRFQSTNSLDFFFRHYCSLNNETRQWPSMIRRELGYGLHLSRTERVSGLLQEVRRRFGLRKKVPDNHELLPGAFAMWINILSSISARAVVMIDGVENLRPVFMEDKPEDSKIVNAKAKGRDELDLDMWMPRQVPNAVRIVLSSTSQSDATTKLVARKWNIYELRSLDLDEKHAILDRWMRAKDISMPERLQVCCVGCCVCFALSDPSPCLQEKLTERTSTSNALFFTSVLRSIQTSHDLRPSGSYGSFYNLRSIHELNSALLRRLEEASEVAGMSEEILTAVSLSRRGLSEYEMLRLLQVPRALFSSFYLNARSIFKVLGGLISFDNSSLEDAVRRRYLQHPQSVKSSRLRLAASFLTRELSFRTVEEVPWQLFQCKRWQDLSNQIMNPTFFLKLAEHPKGMADLVFYWRFLGSDEGGAINIIDRCEDCVRQASDLELDLTPRIALVKSVAELLHRMNYYDIALSFHRRVREMEDHELGLTFLSHVQHMLTEARLVADKGDFRGSKLIFWRAVEMLREEVDQDNDGNITYQELKSSSAGTLFLDTEEEFVYVLWEAGAYSDLEEICLKMLKREEDRPTNELLLFDSLVHVYLERGKNDTAFSFMHTCVKEVPFRCRDEYMHVLSRLLGFLSISERHVEIVKLVESDAQLTSEICEADPSKLRMDAVDAAALYALALSRGGRAEEALDMLKTCLLKVNPLPDEDEDDGDESESSSESSVVYEGDEEEAEEAGEEVRLADCLVSGAMMFELASLIHRQLFEFEIAQDLLQRSIFIKKIEFGTRDPCVAFSVGELASLYESVRNKEMALRMRAIACAIMSGSQGHKSLLYYRALLAQAVSFWKFGSHEAALTVVTSIISNVENQFGSSHELLLQANNLHAFVLLATGDLRQAEERIDRNIRLCRALRSESHPDTLLAENCLGQLLELRGDFELAELKYKEVMEKRRQHMGMFHEYLFQDVTCLVLLYSRLGALAEAEELVRDNLPCINAFYAPESLPLAAMFDLLSVTQLARDVKSHQALDPRTSATRSLRARRKLQGKDSDHFLLFAALHGLLLLHSDHVKMACQLLQLASDLAQGSRFISSALKSIIHEQLSLSMARVRKQDPTFSLSQQKKPWESENAVSSNDSRGGGTSDYFLSLVHGQKSRRGYQDVIQQVDEVASSKTSARGQEEVGLEQRVSRGGWRPLSANAVKSDRWTSLVRKRPNTAHVTRQRRDAIDVTRATTEGGAIG
eukprot:764114-Hanusia_phi.AAC.2